MTWYKEGLRFKCTECGKCCSGSPGYVWITEEEVQKMAAFLKISIPEFQKKYTRYFGSRLALLEKPKQNYDCIFLKDKRCTVYEVRPHQCRSYPWWPGLLASKQSFEEAAKYCEGINENAPLIPFEEIQSWFKE